MKVIQNNYKNTQRNTYQLPDQTKRKVEKVKIKCENCGSVLEVSREDTHTGWLGLQFVNCPCCDYEIDIEEFGDDSIDICASNVNYPTHFTLFKEEFNTLEKIQKNMLIMQVLVTLWYICIVMQKIKNIML